MNAVYLRILAAFEQGDSATLEEIMARCGLPSALPAINMLGNLVRQDLVYEFNGRYSITESGKETIKEGINEEILQSIDSPAPVDSPGKPVSPFVANLPFERPKRQRSEVTEAEPTPKPGIIIAAVRGRYGGVVAVYPQTRPWVPERETKLQRTPARKVSAP